MSTTRVSYRLRAASVAVALLASCTGLGSTAAHADVPPSTIVYTANPADDAGYGVNAATCAVTRKIPVGHADGIGAGLDEITPAPGGRVLYALSSGYGYGYVRYTGSLVSINAADLQITGYVTLPDGATSFVLSPNGATAYVVVGTRIDVIDLSTMTVTRLPAPHRQRPTSRSQCAYRSVSGFRGLSADALPARPGSSPAPLLWQPAERSTVLSQQGPLRHHGPHP